MRTASATAATAATATVARPRSLGRLGASTARWRRVDLLLLGSVLAIALSGVLMIHSSTRSATGGAAVSGFVVRQAMWVVVGLVAMVVTAIVDYRKLRSAVPWVYGGMLLVLLVVISPLGTRSKGAQSWFAVGGIQIEPSEYAKLVIILALAAYGARHHERLGRRYATVMVGIAAIPMALIELQPDLGTVLVIAAITFGMLLVAGVRGRYLVSLVAIAAALAIAVIQLGVLKQYQLDRLGAFLAPESDTQQAAYNLNQSKIAIGSGGLTGKGLFLGTQTNLRFVPEQHTDFIFTVIGEELGLLGAGTMLLLFAIVAWRTWVTARDAADTFGALICVGVLALLGFQVFENIGMTMGIMPITGIPLPFVSYGGSATLAAFLGIGLVVNVRYRSER